MWRERLQPAACRRSAGHTHLRAAGTGRHACTRPPAKRGGKHTALCAPLGPVAAVEVAVAYGLGQVGRLHALATGEVGYGARHL